MFARSLWVLVALALCVFAQSAEAIIMNDGAQSDTSWQQAYQTLGDQYPSVVGLYGYNGTSWHNIGSGVVVSPYNVITAAHVVLDNSGGTFSEYAIETGNNLKTPSGIYYATKASVIPQYTGITVSPDIGMLTFSQPIGVTPAPLYTGSDTSLLHSVATLSGFGDYGYPSTGPTAFDGLKRGCQDLLLELGDPAVSAGSDQLIMDFATPGSWDYQYLGGSTAPGDSGGGWFVNGQLVGVNDFIAGGYDYGLSGATSVSQHIDWIDSQIVPEPGTLALLSAAAASFLFYWTRRRSG